LGTAVLELEGFGYSYPEGAAVLRDVDLRIEAGQCHCITGPTGSGKTTLALAAAGLLSGGRRAGAARLSGPAASARVGLVLQNPETQLLAGTVGAEVAFALENQCVAPEQMPDRVRAALDAVGLERPLEFEGALLSMGQKYRLLVAAALVMEPRLLVLDEPTAQLDDEGRGELLAVMRRLKGRGVAFLVCEHHPERLAAVTDRRWELGGGGQLRPATLSGPEADGQATPSAGVRVPATSGGADPVVAARGLEGRGVPGERLWGGLELDLNRGQCLALCGPNGSGKTSLLRCLTGFARPARGELRVFGQDPRAADLRGRVGCLYQDPSRQLFESTVREEVAFARRRLGGRPGAVERDVDRVLEECSIAHLAEQSPHKLSYGQAHLVGLASVLVHEPELLLLDDPLAGLDPDRGQALLELLRSRCRERQTAVVWTTHDAGAVPSWVDARALLGEPDREG